MTMMRRRARFFFVAISALLIDSLFCNGIKAFGIGRSRSRFRSRSHATRSERSSLVSNGEVDNRNVFRNNGDSNNNNNNENAVSVAPEDRRSRSPRRQNHRPPTVVICGGGPSGLLAAILLDSIGIPSTVVERASETSGWGAKSYVMVLDEKGQGALARAGEGCLEAAIECGHLRRFTGFVNASDGSVRRVPRKGSPGLAITRDGLVRCLERIAEERPGVTVTRGTGVSGIVFAGDRDNDSDSDRENDDDNGLLWVELNDGSRIPATHVIGADGKWSNVRRTVPSFSSTLVTCPSAAIVITLDSIPEGWDPDGNYVIQPERSSDENENENDNDNDTDFYCIALAIPNTQRVSLAMIYFDSMLEKHPWLAPPDGDESDDDGNESDHVDDDDDRSPPDPLPDRLERLLEEHVPALAALLDDRAYETATRKRRVTWLRMEAHAPNGADDDDDDPFVSYSSGDGRISLIGDAAHAMTASTGQGCNTALESAVKLFDHLVGTMRESESESERESDTEIDAKREEGDEGDEERETDASRGANCTREIMSRAFVRYGTSRPEECIAVQEKSVSASSGRPRR